MYLKSEYKENLNFIFSFTWDTTNTPTVNALGFGFIIKHAIAGNENSTVNAVDILKSVVLVNNTSHFIRTSEIHQNVATFS